MRKIVDNLRSFIIEDFSALTYGFASLMMLLLLWVNYLSPLKGSFYTLEERMGDILRPKNLFYLWYIPFHGLPYLMVLLVKLYQSKSISIVCSKEFWKKFIVILAILCLDGGFYINSDYAVSSDFSKQYVILLAGYVVHSFLTILVPLAIYYFAVDQSQYPFMYGLAKGNFEIKPYLIMLGLMVPIVGLASFNTAFQDQYPTIEPNYVMDSFGFTKTQIIIGYEFLYLLDFLNVELLFRGLMIIGMTKVLGKHAVLPTVVVYMLLHFEKPLGESIGAIFGGVYIIHFGAAYPKYLGGCYDSYRCGCAYGIFCFFAERMTVIKC